MRRIARAVVKWLLRILGILLVLLGATLAFFQWQSTRRESRSGAEAAPPGGGLVQAADIRVFVQEAGPKTGTPVLLVHGTCAWSEI